MKSVCVPTSKKIFGKPPLAIAGILSFIFFGSCADSAHAQTITEQPTSQTVQVGQTAVFSVGFTGGPCRSFWYTGAIGNHYGAYGPSPISLSIPDVTSAMNGTKVQVQLYGCTGASNNSTSSEATLTVVTSQSALAIATKSLPNGTVSDAYSQTLSATGGTSPYTWSLTSGSLPKGLTLSSNGKISGTPTAAASYSFTVQVQDAKSAKAASSLGINVGTASLPSVSITSPANGSTVSGSISLTGSATDSLGITAVQVSVDGGSYGNGSGTTSWTFPVNTTALSNGTHTFIAKVSDSAGRTATSSLLDLNVNNTSAAGDCTIYASPSGGGNGASSSSPTSLSAAASATRAGSVVCLLGGTYNLSSTFVPPNSGSPSSWITYKAYNGSSVDFVWTGAADAEPMIKVGGGSFPSGPAYIVFQGLKLNGSSTAADGFFCRGGHHVSFLSNSVSDTGGSGIASINCDYLVVDHNLINHNGYIPSSTSVPQYYSWTSAVSFNTHEWFDNYPGIHSVISNNIITGEVDQSSHHTDGNGIILDLGGNTPPALILNNVVYGNGGTCIIANHVENFYTINNTCYDNDLDPNEPGFSEIASNDSSNGYVVNNISFSWNTNNPAYGQYNGSANNAYYRDLMFGAGTDFTYSDPSQFIQANPLFASAPPLALGGFVSSLAPSLLGNDLTLLSGSSAFSRGIDPSAISGLSSSIMSDLKKYVYTDINGKTRPQGGGADLGAYQH